MIINDPKHVGVFSDNDKQNAKEFNKFESINIGALQYINAKEAKKAIVRAEKMNKSNSNKPLRNKSSMFNESILLDMTSVKTSFFNEEMKEQDDEETPSVFRGARKSVMTTSVSTFGQKG